MKLEHIKSEAVLAELIGTFGLTMAVLVALTTSLGIFPGVIAAATLGLFVLLIGSVSGSHINPAVTIAQYSVGKIDISNAIAYVIAQLSGGLLALVVLSLFNDGVIFELGGEETWSAFFGEALGAAVFGFAIASSIYNKLDGLASAFAVGGGLFIGIIIASIASNGLLNPAVAIGVGSSTWPYILGPIVGLVVGMQLQKLAVPHKKKSK